MNRAGREWLMRVCALALCALLAAQPAASDEADDLLDAAEDATAAEEHRAAGAAYERIWAKDATRIDALYLAAKSYEKHPDRGAALLAYRAFVQAYEASAKPSADLKTSYREATKKVKTLGKLQSQAEVIGDRHAAKLAALALKYEVDAPLVALRALEHAEALTMNTSVFAPRLARLRAQLDAPLDRVKSPFEDKVVKWDNLLTLETFANAEGWDFGETYVVIEAEQSAIAIAKDTGTAEDESYVFEMEVRVKEMTGTLAVIGLVFGSSGYQGLSAWMCPHSVELKAFNGPKIRGLAAYAQSLKELDVWHRVTVCVRNGKCEVLLDGKELGVSEIPSGWSPSGKLGVTVQDGRFEVRELRLGVLR